MFQSKISIQRKLQPASLRKHQMADDAGATRGPGGLGGPGVGGLAGFCGGFSSGVQGQGRGWGRGWGRRRDRGWGRGARGVKAEDKEWILITRLGGLVKDMKIKSLEIYLFSLPIKESEIVNFFLGASLKDEVLKIMLMQKQVRAGQRTWFKASIAIGDYNGHVDLGVKCSKEVATAIRGGSHPGQALHCPYAARLLGEQDWQAPHRP